jgi:site-specific recombinase XerC
MGNHKAGGENDMNELATRAGNDIKQMAEILATFPEPGKWTQKQKEQAIEFAALLDTAQKVIAAKNIAGINYSGEKETFLNNAGRTQSEHTRKAYRAGLERLDAWAAAQGINPLEMTPAQSDDFIYSLRGRSAASIRLDVAAASSFFTWMHRRHNAIDNPFRGSKARPAKKSVKEVDPPQAAEEIETIIRELPASLAAAAAIMAYRGLRAGALPTLSIAGGKFTGFSKGKPIQGKLPPEALDAIKAASLPLRGPFAGILPNTLEKQIARAIKKLYQAGEVKAAYSAHDLRHYYAITEYRKDRDIRRVSKLLGHASIQITQNYLEGLGEVE